MFNLLNESNSETKNENDISVCNANRGISEKLRKYVNISKHVVIYTIQPISYS